MAEGYARIYLNIGVDRMAETVLAMIDKYAAEGLVMHSNRSCKPYSLGQYDIARIVQEKRGLPTLIIEANMKYGRKGLRMKGLDLKEILRTKLLAGELSGQA